MKINRIENATKGTFYNMISIAFSILGSFAVRTVLIWTMGLSYNGLSSLFTSILQVLNLAELGVSEALIFGMYKPLIEDDTEKMCALLHLYKKYYRMIGGAILILGGILLPVLPYLIKADIPEGINLYVLYLLTLSETVFSYWFFSYKASLLYASQRIDLTSKVSIVRNFFRYGGQILVLFVTHNFYLFTIVALLSQVLSNVLSLLVVNRLYPQYKPIGDIPKVEKGEINKRVLDVFTLKVGRVVLNNVDFVVVSAVFGLTVLGIYQSYYYILTVATLLTGACTEPCKAGIGNSLLTESKEKNYKDLRVFSVFMGCIMCVSTASLFTLFQHFVTIWIGEKSLLSYGMMCLFVVYYYVYSLNQTFDLFKDAAGVWKRDKWRPLSISVLNLALNLILVQFIGLYGILLSTVLVLVLISFPWELRVLFAEVYGQGLFSYLLLLLKNVLVTVMAAALSGFVCAYLPGEGLLMLIVKGIVTVCISVLLLLLVYVRSEEFQAVYAIMKRMLGRIRRKAS